MKSQLPEILRVFLYLWRNVYFGFTVPLIVTVYDHNNSLSFNRVVDLWKGNLSQSNKKAGDSLADPKQYENLFPGMAESIVAEQYLTSTEQRRLARNYPVTPVIFDALFSFQWTL